MNLKISQRMARPDFQADFLAEILNSCSDPDIISFAGGLPNPSSFPVAEINEAAGKVLKEKGVMALQYSGTQGYLPLREYIAQRYKKSDLDIVASQIIITNGSQQALDMFAACMIDEGDNIMIENPSYLAALQTFHLYNPKVLPIDLHEDGIDLAQLEATIKEYAPKFIYMIPNFQNPTGLTYTEEVRVKASEIFKNSDVVVLEDNPYGELRFSGQAGHSFSWFLGEQCCLLGSFSKVVSPGMRLGWIVCKNQELLAKLLAYKSTMDLHTNMFGQMVIHQYLLENDLDAHIEKTRLLYKEKAAYMMRCMDKYFPEGISYTKPEGGMFLWVTLPEGIKAVDVQFAAIEKGVAVCAGDPFYETERGVRTMRLNYSNSSDEAMDKGISILADVIRSFMK